MSIFIFILSLSLFYFEKGYAQNLVPNGSFENYIQCPSGPIGINLGYVPPWTGISVDFFHSCNNQINGVVGVPQNQYAYQWPHNGQGFAGLYFGIYGPNQDYDREYLQTSLLRPLLNNKKYCVNFFVNFMPLNSPTNIVDCIAVEDIGLYIGNCINGPPGVPLDTYVPQIINQQGILQDTLNWIGISGFYTAQGGETCVTIGNFKSHNSFLYTIVIDNPSDTGAAYYVVDSVSLTECRPPVFANDTLIINQGSSIMIGDTAQDVANYYWSPVTDLSCPTCWQSNASPQQTTTYTLTKVTPCDTTQASITIVVIPDTTQTPVKLHTYYQINPTASQGNFTLSYYNQENSNIKIYDVSGRIVYRETLLPTGQHTQHQIMLQHLAQGMYIFVIEQNNKREYTKKIVIVK